MLYLSYLYVVWLSLQALIDNGKPPIQEDNEIQMKNTKNLTAIYLCQFDGHPTRWRWCSDTFCSILFVDCFNISFCILEDEKRFFLSPSSVAVKQTVIVAISWPVVFKSIVTYEFIVFQRYWLCHIHPKTIFSIAKMLCNPWLFILRKLCIYRMYVVSYPISCSRVFWASVVFLLRHTPFLAINFWIHPSLNFILVASLSKPIHLIFCQFFIRYMSTSTLKRKALLSSNTTSLETCNSRFSDLHSRTVFAAMLYFLDTTLFLLPFANKITSDLKAIVNDHSFSFLCEVDFVCSSRFTSILLTA